MVDTKAPKYPLGTRVRGKLSGWDEAQADDYVASYEQSLDIVPTFEGAPETVEGVLEGFFVNVTADKGYFKHVVDGYDVDPETLEELGDPNSESTAATVGAADPYSLLNDSRRLLDIDRELRNKLHVAFNDHMARALERAGAKIRTRMSKTASGRQWLNGHPCNNGTLARITPRNMVAAGGLEESMLLNQAWDDLRPIWDEFVATSDTALLRQIARMTGIDINTMFGQEKLLRAASEEGWEFAQARLNELGHGYLSDSASLVPTDEINTTSLVDMGDVRQSVSIAGGSGTTDPLSAGLNIGDDMSIGVTPQLSNGPIAQETLKSGDLEIESYTWVHGFTPSPFEPHVALDGVKFEKWEDSKLFNSGSWPSNTYFMPGDHVGCQCDYYINWRK
jgi:hypothetical protein